MSYDLELALQVLHEITAEELLNRLRSGKATEAEISQAINLLKHNGLTMALYSGYFHLRRKHVRDWV